MGIVSSLPNTIKPHPAGFVYKNNKIKLSEPSLETLTGDQVCAKYYKEYFEVYNILRADVYAEQNPRKSPEFQLPYMIYPGEYSPRPHIDVPVEAVLGEVYEPTDGRKRTGQYGCYVTCQDIRKTMEIMITAKLRRSIQTRVKFLFAFDCLWGMIARPTKRESWREEETAEEFQAAIDFMKTVDRADFTMLERYDLLLNGDKGEITGCECYIPSEEEKIVADSRQRSKRHREQQKSAARDMIRRKTKSRPSWYRSRASASPRASVVGSSAGHELDAAPAAATASETVDSHVDGFDIYNPLDFEFTGEMTVQAHHQARADRVSCQEYDYPNIDVGLPASSAVTIQHMPEMALLQASLLDLTDFDFWPGLQAHDGTSSSRMSGNR